MSDKGRSAAIEELRREVGYGCPICRSPFLTWHHFDPPWHVEHHWRASGIVAMCLPCHADADEKGDQAGAYSADELRAMKKSSRSSEDVRGQFPTWRNKETLLVRVGGCYTDTFSPAVSVNGVPQILLGKNPAGVLALSFQLRNASDHVLVEMVDNWFTAYPENVHDMIATPKTKQVKVWLARDDVGLEFSFRRIAADELDEILKHDWDRAENLSAKWKQEWLARMPPEAREFIERCDREHQAAGQQPPFWLKELPDELREAYLAEDKTAHLVKHWVKANCTMDDGLIPFLNFDQMAIYYHGIRHTIKDGIADSISYCAMFQNGAGAVNLRCPCAACMARTVAPSPSP